MVGMGVKPSSVRVYLVNGDCMISPEAKRIEKNSAPKDYIAVERADLGGRRPAPGDVVVAWWEEEQKMIVKRYKIEREGIVLSPTNPAHPNLVLDHEDSIQIIGRVIMRTG